MRQIEEFIASRFKDSVTYKQHPSFKIKDLAYFVGMMVSPDNIKKVQATAV